MAIASIIIVAPDERLNGLEALLRGRASVVETRRTPDDAVIPGLAVVLERSSAELRAELEDLSRIPGVDELHLVFANFEDDIDAEGNMPCPPRGEGKRRRRSEDLADEADVWSESGLA